MEKMKVIFDTDIGDDIDDALALALVLELPQIELLGVTTVFLNTDERARIARKMLKLWGRDVPVYAGIRNGEGMNHNIHTWKILSTRRSTMCLQTKAAARWISFWRMPANTAKS